MVEEGPYFGRILTHYCPRAYCGSIEGGVVVVLLVVQVAVIDDPGLAFQVVYPGVPDSTQALGQ